MLRAVESWEWSAILIGYIEKLEDIEDIVI